MDIFKCYEELNRMCSLFVQCKGCPLKNKHCRLFDIKDKNMLEELVSIIEKWSESNPIITNRDKFKEVFGYDGALVSEVEPINGLTHGSCGYEKCSESCASRCFPRCPMWWNDEYNDKRQDKIDE